MEERKLNIYIEKCIENVNNSLVKVKQTTPVHIKAILYDDTVIESRTYHIEKDRVREFADALTKEASLYCKTIALYHGEKEPTLRKPVFCIV